MPRKAKTYATLSGPGPLPNRQALVIFTGSPLPRFVGSGYNLASAVQGVPLNIYLCAVCKFVVLKYGMF
jgi:hypothetical protein